MRGFLVRSGLVMLCRFPMVPGGVLHGVRQPSCDGPQPAWTSRAPSCPGVLPRLHDYRV